jgi:hypothetical protein
MQFNLFLSHFSQWLQFHILLHHKFAIFRIIKTMRREESEEQTKKKFRALKLLDG